MSSQNLGNFYLLVDNMCLYLATESDCTVSLTKEGLIPSTIFPRAMVT